jgi:hypothetical protein
VEFCYNFTKHFIVGVRPFELALGVEISQPMTLTIARIGGEHCKRSKMLRKWLRNAKKNAKAKFFWKKHRLVIRNKKIRFKCILNLRLATLCV